MAEEAVLAFWKEQDIFKKTTERLSPNGEPRKEFVFFEGPPTANAKPALHHLAARAFKDVIPRYKTMQGFHVRRRAGWDTHGLPVELQIEKKLGLQSKKDIESFGVAAFNKECKDSVFTYIKEWETFTERIGYWVDEKDAYYTFNATFMESLWYIIGQADTKDLLYKDYKVLPWCPRCGTALSSHELAQGYQDVKELSVYAQFKLVAEQWLPAVIAADDDVPTFVVAWTTTPWTLPGNVALAVGEDISYAVLQATRADGANTRYVIAKERLSVCDGLPFSYEIIGEIKGADLAGLAYEPLYPVDDSVVSANSAAYRIQVADFVTTTDGTGVVHIAPMYGADDFLLATKAGLPKLHTVDDTGHFSNAAGIAPDFLKGRFAKDEAVAVDIIKDLAHRGLLFKKEKYEHSYPHCWRCKTALLYYARDSWYIRMSSLRESLVAGNEAINWEPSHIKNGRFGEWLRNINDWAISRERYWGTPLPVWLPVSADGTSVTGAAGAKDRIVVDSLKTLKRYAKKSGNVYTVMRHGETSNNVAERWNCDVHAVDPLTENGVAQVRQSAAILVEKAQRDGRAIDLIVMSPFPRTEETARIVAETLGISSDKMIVDERLSEWNVGPQYDGKSFIEFFAVRNTSDDRYHFAPEGGESYAQVFTRASDVLYSLEKEYKGKNILIITHGAVTRALELASRGARFDTMLEETREYRNFDNAEFRDIDFAPLPHNEHYELDLHRPFIDGVVLEKDGVEYRRVKEVMDVWFDSGSMPFAQDHYPFEPDKKAYGNDYIETSGIPADFICEAIDQTRGWFYTLHAVGALMGKPNVYKNVICLGHLLDAEGKKMSKSIGNIVEPYSQLDSFGADAVRFWMYSVNQPGESKNYDPKSVADIQNKVFNLYGNVLAFYELYRNREKEISWQRQWEQRVVIDSADVLDQWIARKTHALVGTVTADLDGYDIFHATRTMRAFLDDLSTWYLRRSRDRMKDGDAAALQTLYGVLKTVALLFAPFAPFTAESAWQQLRAELDEESVHLAAWPKGIAVVFDGEDVAGWEDRMEQTRTVCAAGNALRKKISIPVRQPLASITIGVALPKEYHALIEEELNVKAVLHASEYTADQVSLDEVITDALRAEGAYRELVRVVQDMRKAQGLSPSDSITLVLPLSIEHATAPFIADLQKAVQAAAVSFADVQEPVVAIVGA